MGEPARSGREARQQSGRRSALRTPTPEGAGQRLPADAYLASILDQSAEAIISTDINGHILSWNPAAEELFGYPGREVAGNELACLAAHAEAAQLLSRMVSRVTRGGRHEERILSCARRDGTSVEVVLRMAPICDAQGTTSGLCVIASRASSEHRLDEEHQRRDQFLTIMSHELRTPLTAILGYTDLLLRGVAGPLEPRTTTYVSHVRTAGGHLLDLVGGLLEFSRLEAGTERVALEPVDLNRAATHAVDRTRPEAEARDLRLDLTTSDGELEVLAHEDKLQLILRHFMANAVKFTPRGGRIHVRASRDPSGSPFGRVAIEDNGVGLDERELNRVWERFYQVDTSLTREHRGVGLGLATVTHLARLLSGQVWVESPGLGAGSTFWLSLPLASESQRSLGS